MEIGGISQYFISFASVIFVIGDMRKAAMSQIKLFFHFFLHLLAVLAALAASACSTGPSAQNPRVGLGKPASRGIVVNEYALTEQSTDNPTHLAFFARVPEAISAQRRGVLGASTAELIALPNRVLERFGYQLAPNQAPPFSSFTLLHSGALVTPLILHFWPAALTASGKDFLFPFETVNGERLIASTQGISAWPDEHANDSALNLPAGDTLIVQRSSAPASLPRPLSQRPPAGTPARPIYTQLLGNQSFSVYTRDDQVHLRGGEHDLAYFYDQVIHDQTGELASFNPAGTPAIAWFFALRDGVWYYVEAGTG
jgi:hypothetical protein